ncbi:hypothetical protein FRC02_000563 [Tulasnella sp. 418]|nr:hypothetical protein FRC02_000563 [Tulasnella sp. 418]
MPAELLKLTPSYCAVGIYRLLSDPLLRAPVWQKCRNGLIRGTIVGGIWAFFTYRVQHAFVSLFLMKSPRVTGLSNDHFFGFEIPLATYATIIFMSSQVSSIIAFFLSKNIRLAKERAWNQVVISRGKAPDFWGPYVEEWEEPPRILPHSPKWGKWLGSWIGRLVVNQVVIIPIKVFIPFAGLIISSAIKAVSTARYLHYPYFTSKKMTPQQIAVYMEEHKFDYYAFGFCSALLESLPIIGLLFSISNRIGGAMWAFDLEKRQDLYRKGVKKPKPPRRVYLADGEVMKFDPWKWGSSKVDTSVEGDEMAGRWVDPNESRPEH